MMLRIRPSSHGARFYDKAGNLRDANYAEVFVKSVYASPKSQRFLAEYEDDSLRNTLLRDANYAEVFVRSTQAFYEFRRLLVGYDPEFKDCVEDMPPSKEEEWRDIQRMFHIVRNLPFPIDTIDTKAEL